MLRKYSVLCLFVVSTAVNCMELAKPKPFTEEEMEAFNIFAWGTDIDKELANQAKDDVAQKAPLGVWGAVYADPVYQRVAISSQEVKNQLHEKLYSWATHACLMLSNKLPFRANWPMVQRAIATCELVGAEPEEYYDLLDWLQFKELRLSALKVQRKAFALEVACLHNDHNLATLLLCHGADPNTVTNFVPAYVHARSRKMAKLLLKYGADYKLSKHNGINLLNCRACNDDNLDERKESLIAFYYNNGVTDESVE